MKGKNIALVVAGVMTILLAITCFWEGWWFVGGCLLLGGGFLLFRLGGSRLGLTQLDLLKKLPGKKSWWVYGLAGVSTLYWVLLLFGVLKWADIVLNVCAFLSIALLAFSIAGSKDTPAGLQGIMKLLGKLSIIGLLVLILVVRFFPSWVNYLDYSASDPQTSVTSPAPQERVAPPSPTPTPTPRATQRVVASGKVIILNENKIYDLGEPGIRKSFCLTYLGIPRDKMVNQKVKVGEEVFSEMGTVCKDISHLSGKLSIVIFPDDNWSSQQIRDFYAYWRDQPGGQGEFPMIRIGE